MADETVCARCDRPVTTPRRVKQPDGSIRVLGTWCAWREAKDAENAARTAAAEQ